MSTETNYDPDCLLVPITENTKILKNQAIKIENDEKNYLIKMIEEVIDEGIEENYLSLNLYRKLYKLFIQNIIDYEEIDDNYIKQIGNYYERKKDYDNMKKYYEIAIEKGNTDAMIRLGSYYEEQKDYYNMKKYYEMAIEKGDTDAMTILGDYYKELKDYDNYIKYNELAIEKGSICAITKLRDYYKEQNDYDNMKKYYEMAIKIKAEQRRITSLNSLDKRLAEIKRGI